MVSTNLFDDAILQSHEALKIALKKHPVLTVVKLAPDPYTGFVILANTIRSVIIKRNKIDADNIRYYMDLLILAQAYLDSMGLTELPPWTELFQRRAKIPEILHRKSLDEAAYEILQRSCCELEATYYCMALITYYNGSSEIDFRANMLSIMELYCRIIYHIRRISSNMENKRDANENNTFT